MGQLTKSGFDLQPKDMGEAMQLATMICNSQLAPKNYQRKPEDTLVAMMMGNELGLNPLQAIQNIAVINGRPSIYGDALMALVQNHPAFGGISESFDESTMTATCVVWRKGGEKHTQTFSQNDAQKANLWGKQGPWSQYPKRMLTMRARGFALRNQFADALAGLITREEAEDMPVEREINPAPTGSQNTASTAKGLSQLLSSNQQQEPVKQVSQDNDLGLEMDQETASQILQEAEQLILKSKNRAEVNDVYRKYLGALNGFPAYQKTLQDLCKEHCKQFEDAA